MTATNEDDAPVCGGGYNIMQRDFDIAAGRENPDLNYYWHCPDCGARGPQDCALVVDSRRG